jgi:hypothetical protein
MPKKLTEDEIILRLAHRSDELSIDIKSFVGINSRCRFIDVVHGEFFCTFDSVVRKGVGHPNRTKDKLKANSLSTSHEQKLATLEKRKATNIEKYGCDFSSQNPDVKTKIKQTCQERYGASSPLGSKDIIKKSTETSLNKYGVLNPGWSEDAKIKRTKTNLNRYGKDNPAKNKEVIDAIKETNLERYGVACIFQCTDVKNTVKRNMMEKYGVSHPMKAKEVWQKVNKTNLAKYGTIYATQSEEIKAKTSATNIKKYGFSSPLTRHVDPNSGQSISSMCSEKGVPVSSCLDILRVDGLNAALKYIAEYDKIGAMSSLEFKVHSQLNIPLFNKKPVKTVPHRPDFQITANTYLDVDGLYWHSIDKVELKKHHATKRKTYEEAGLRLFQIRADEIDYKFPIVSSIINNILGKSTKLYARKTKIKIVNHKEASVFLESSHLMGSTKAKHIGLYLEEELVCIMSYCKKADGILKVQRFCNKLNTTVVGGFSKLLKFIEDKEKPKEIHNWVDLRYGTGKHLESKGFVLTRETLGWKWTDLKNTYNRLKCRANMDDRRLTEKEHAAELGLYKIYDAGQRLYVKTI